MPSTTSSAVSIDDEISIRGIVKQLASSWARNDADTMSMLYAEDASVVLPGDTYLKGRQAIRDWMTAAFDGKWKGTHVLGIPLEVKHITDSVVLIISQGGAYRPGATEVSADDAIRGLWVFAKHDGEWTITAYENTPVRATIPIPQTPK